MKIIALIFIVIILAFIGQACEDYYNSHKSDENSPKNDNNDKEV